jgi:serine-type D-Ala-D-Ala carboxypeptidase (penicillin-binding protein 5/6)
MPFARQHSARRATSHACLALLALIVAFALTTPAGVRAAPDSPGTAATGSAIEPPQVTARSIYVFDMTSGIELYAKNPDERLQVGSIVKMATALVVMENAELDEQVVILESDLVNVEEFSNMNLTAGDTLTVSQLLYGLLIPSGNDGARALARHVGMKLSGSDDPTAATDAFVSRMNAYAAELGLKDTRFTVPDGIDTPNSYSTAHDVAILGSALMKNEFLASVVREPGYSFISVGPEQRQYEKATTNSRLGQSGVVGIKTGTTGEAGGNAVLARDVNGGNSMVIMAIVGADHPMSTGDPNTPDARWTDADTLMANMDTTFTWTTPDNAELLPGLSEEMGVWEVQFQNPPAVPVPSGGDIALGYQLQVGPPAEPGKQAGAVHLYYGDQEVGVIPIYQVGEQAVTMPRYRMGA